MAALNFSATTNCTRLFNLFKARNWLKLIPGNIIDSLTIWQWWRIINSCNICIDTRGRNWLLRYSPGRNRNGKLLEKYLKLINCKLHYEFIHSYECQVLLTTRCRMKCYNKKQFFPACDCMLRSPQFKSSSNWYYKSHSLIAFRHPSHHQYNTTNITSKYELDSRCCFRVNSNEMGIYLFGRKF